MWEQRDRNAILAKVIVIGMAYAGYHVYAGIDRRLGKGTLGHMMWRRT